jgi:hypothetical protein
MNTYYIQFNFLTDCAIELKAISIEDASRQFYAYDLEELLYKAGNGDGPEITFMLENGTKVEPDYPEDD